MLLGKNLQLLRFINTPSLLHRQAFAGPNTQDTDTLKARSDGIKVLIDTILQTMSMYKDIFPLMGMILELMHRLLRYIY